MYAVYQPYDPKACKHGDTCVSTMSLGHKAVHGNEDVFLIDMKFSHVIQIVSKDIEEKFQVRRGVDMLVRNGIDELQEHSCVDQVSILWRVFSGYSFLSLTFLGTPESKGKTKGRC
jgi:hypothetical protein